jgi:lysyl-tRNA synthetase, class II
MEFTEELLSKMVMSIHGSYKIKIHPNPECPEDTQEIDFTPPFRRIPMMEGLEKALGVKMPKSSELDTEEARKFFDELCTDNDIECKEPRTTARMIDKLVGEYLECQCISPAFIIDHP